MGWDRAPEEPPGLALRGEALLGISGFTTVLPVSYQPEAQHLTRLRDQDLNFKER